MSRAGGGLGPRRWVSRHPAPRRAALRPAGALQRTHGAPAVRLSPCSQRCRSPPAATAATAHTPCRATPPCRDTLATCSAIVFLHRFYATKSLVRNDPFVSPRRRAGAPGRRSTQHPAPLTGRRPPLRCPRSSSLWPACTWAARWRTAPSPCGMCSWPPASTASRRGRGACSTSGCAWAAPGWLPLLLWLAEAAAAAAAAAVVAGQRLASPACSWGASGGSSMPVQGAAPACRQRSFCPHKHRSAVLVLVQRSLGCCSSCATACTRLLAAGAVRRPAGEGVRGGARAALRA